MATILTRKDHLVFHFRVRDEAGVALPRGGATVVFVPELSRFGVSICSDKDVFSRKRGRVIASGRALSKNSFCPFDSESPATIEVVRMLARELARDGAVSILGHEAVRAWTSKK